MTAPAQRFRRWPKGPGAMLRLLLAVLLLVPVGALFVQSWQGVDEELTSADRERQGIEYLRSLEQVTVALVDAQSAAVARQPVLREALTLAVENTTSVDARLGEELRTRERWAGVRAKIEALPQRNLPDPTQVFAGYTEATDLILALYAKVRETSGLIRDPDADSYALQDSVVEELPEALVAAGRLADLAMFSSASRSNAEQLQAAIGLAGGRNAVLEPVEDMVEGLQSAVNTTESQQLSGNLLSRLDAYQLAVDALGAATAPTAGAAAVDPEAIAAARTSAQVAGLGLSEVMFNELDALVETRADGLRTERLLAIAAGTAALLIVGALIASTLTGARRRTTGGRTDPPPTAAQPEPQTDFVERRRGWDLPTDWSDPVPAGRGARAGHAIGARDISAPARDSESARWGRNDVAR